MISMSYSTYFEAYYIIGFIICIPIGEIYWVVSANSNIVPYKWDNDSIDNSYFDFGNCFKTKEEAEAMAEKIKKLLKGEQL